MDSKSFISQKAIKIRFKPTGSSLVKPSSFLTGCYEDPKNAVSLWKLTQGDPMINVGETQGHEPKMISQCHVKGGVAGMEFFSMNIFIVGSSNGSVSLYQIQDDQSITLLQTWSNLHKYLGTTDVGSNPREVVSVGSAGEMNIMRPESVGPLRRYGRADNCAITSVKFLSSHDICTTNVAGQLRIFDARSPSESPARVMLSNESLVPLRSVDQHPTRGHILATGGGGGDVTIFDTRKEKSALFKLQVHDQEIWETKFHRTSPQHLFTCSQDRSLRRLDATFDAGSSPIDVIDVLSHCGAPINSLDVSGDLLVCCTDTEAVYTLEGAV